MRQYSLIAATAWMGVALLNGCGKPPESPPVSRAGIEAKTKKTGSWQKAGVAFRADWTWTSSANGTARVALTVTPTAAARSLKVQAKFPASVSMAGGESDRLLLSPAANVPVRMTFDLAFPGNAQPMVPVEVLLVIADDHQYAATIPVSDPDATPTVPSEKAGVPTDVGGLPTRIGGEAQPPK